MQLPMSLPLAFLLVVAPVSSSHSIPFKSSSVNSSSDCPPPSSSNSRELSLGSSISSDTAASESDVIPGDRDEKTGFEKEALLK